MPSEVTLRELRMPGRFVRLQHDDACYLWADGARVYGIQREDGEVTLIVGERRAWLRVEADAYLDFVGLRPVRTE